jgi:hypothetical protein
MTGPCVDVIIPVHTDQRPIARAVASVLKGTSTDVQVTVVCHNISAIAITAVLGEWSTDTRVMLLELADGLRSPAGPINAGYAASTAEFTALLDSDDEYEPGAVDAWLRVQRRDDADVVIQPLRHADGTSKRTPPTRPGRFTKLDGVRDRLAYRTRQHGLVRRARFPELAMTPALRTGEDVIQGATLWYSDARISYAARTPAYVIHSDSDDRASTSPKPAAESLHFLGAVLGNEFASRLSTAQRESFAIKLLRTHVMDVLALSLASGSSPTDLAAIRGAVRRILEFSPSTIGIVSRRESRILRELLGPTDPGRLATEHAVLTDYRRPSNLMPATLGKLLHREAPLRFLVASAFTH